jgi:tRNA-specific 2-thiouridylase
VKKVFVGLSGGVDSAVSAYLLKKAGHQVTGVFLKVWEPDFLPCTGPKDRLDAMRVAAHLGIPFLTYNLEEEYKKGVVDYFISEYQAGRTPNPDVMCNREIKFGAFWDRAKKDGAEMLATGHYAQIKLFDSREPNRFAMHRGVDEGKDQSYFLWTLTQEDLAHTFFPVGGMPKSETRRIAKEARLPNFDRKDSQGLCFLGHVDMEEFLKHYIPVERGLVRTVDGKEVGKHDGVFFHTIGQRFPVVGEKKMYVVGKDLKENVLIISDSLETKEFERTVVHLEKTNWISGAPNPEKLYDVQIRYHGEKYKAKIQVNSVQFVEPVLIAPGQSLVVYDAETDECMGGGIISGNGNHR